MTSVFIIAECGSNWRFESRDYFTPNDKPSQLDNAYRMIRAAKECGADAAKFQWVSDYKALMSRRKAPLEEEWAYKYVHFPQDWLPLLKAECDRVGIEFMVTSYLINDIPVIEPLVKRFKIAAKESEWKAFINAHKKYGKEIIVSTNGDDCVAETLGESGQIKTLRCVSKYPCPIEEIGLSKLCSQEDTIFGLYKPFDGLSDHTAHVLTGAVAVGSGNCEIIESHVRLHDTPRECPDYGHSLTIDGPDYSITKCEECWNHKESKGATASGYAEYVQNIRTAERML